MLKGGNAKAVETSGHRTDSFLKSLRKLMQVTSTNFVGVTWCNPVLPKLAATGRPVTRWKRLTRPVTPLEIEAMREEIKVYVVKYTDRDNLVMRYLDPMTNRQVPRSTGTNKRSEAVKIAAKWEAELQGNDFPIKKSSRAMEDQKTYFISQGRTGPIKIGKAANVQSRLKSLQTSSPQPLYLLGVIDSDIEDILHARFERFQIRGEWYEPAPELKRFINYRGNRNRRKNHA